VPRRVQRLRPPLHRRFSNKLNEVVRHDTNIFQPCIAVIAARSLEDTDALKRNSARPRMKRVSISGRRPRRVPTQSPRSRRRHDFYPMTDARRRIRR